MEGWIKLHRKILDNSIFSTGDSLLVQLWIYILLSVNHKPKKILLNGTESTLNEGEGIFGLNQITKDLTKYKKENSKIFQKNRSNYYRRLKILEKIGNIETQATNKFTLIKVKNWNMYQGEGNSIETQTEFNRNSNGIQTKQTRMNKNIKNDNNDKKKEKISKKENHKKSSNQIINTDKDKTPKQKAIEFFESVETESELYQQFIDWCIQNGIEKSFAVSEVKKFYNYWTEKTPSGKKQNWETCKTFEVNRRLSTWFSNAQKWTKGRNNNSSNDPRTEQQKRDDEQKIKDTMFYKEMTREQAIEYLKSKG